MPGANQTNGGGEQSLPRRLLDLTLSALPAIGGTIGFVGFVALLGGAIQWVRFNSVQLPASQAVDAMPQSELVAIGAQYLITFTLLGLFAVICLYVVDPRAKGNTATARALLALAAVESIVVMALVAVPWETLVISVVLVIALTAIAIRIAPATVDLIKRWTELTQLRRFRKDWDENADSARFERAYYAYAVTAGLPDGMIETIGIRVAACERSLAEVEMKWAALVDRLEIEEQSTGGDAPDGQADPA